MLIDDPEDARDLAERIRACTPNIAQWREALAPLGAEFRRRRWSDVARDFVAAVEERFAQSFARGADSR